MITGPIEEMLHAAIDGVLKATQNKKAQLMLYIYPVDPNLFEVRRQIRF